MRVNSRVFSERTKKVVGIFIYLAGAICFYLIGFYVGKHSDDVFSEMMTSIMIIVGFIATIKWWLKAIKYLWRTRHESKPKSI